MFFPLYLTTLLVYKCFWSMGKRLGTNGTSEVAYPLTITSTPFSILPQLKQKRGLFLLPRQITPCTI